MKLKYVVGSPNCRKVHAVIDYLGADVELEYLDFFAGDLRADGYTALNPNAMVPTLVDGDFTLWESNAINVYLVSKQPTGLFPEAARPRADVVRWLCWELAHYNRALGVLAFETVAKPAFMKMQPDEAAVEITRRDLQRFAPVLEQHLRAAVTSSEMRSRSRITRSVTSKDSRRWSRSTGPDSVRSTRSMTAWRTIRIGWLRRRAIRRR